MLYRLSQVEDDDVSPETVSPRWLVDVACKDAATKYAREEALKLYLASRKAPPIPDAVVAADDSILETLVEVRFEELSCDPRLGVFQFQKFDTVRGKHGGGGRRTVES